MKSTLQTLRALAAVTILGSCAAQAAIIFDNFGPGDATAVSGRIVQGPDVGTVGDVDQAVRITLDGGAQVILSSLTMAVAAVQGGDGSLILQIRNDIAGAPGDIVYQLAKAVTHGSPTFFTILPMIGPLDSGTYWFIANGSNTFDGSWAFNSTGDQGITAGRTNGNPWNVRPIEDRYAIRLEGRYVNPVPEPSSMLQLGGGAIALILFARKWRLAR
jgi:hypothetical protein